MRFPSYSEYRDFVTSDVLTCDFDPPDFDTAVLAVLARVPTGREILTLPDPGPVQSVLWLDNKVRICTFYSKEQHQLVGVASVRYRMEYGDSWDSWDNFY